jgi:hypothetical protein
VLPGTEEVGRLALVHEERGLRVAHGELRALLDLHVAHREAPGEDLVAVLGPLNDVDELLLDEVKKPHDGASHRANRDPSTTLGVCARGSQGTPIDRLTAPRGLRYHARP